MAKKFHRSRKMTIPIAAVMGTVAGMVNPIAEFGPQMMQGNTSAAKEMVSHIVANYTGYSLWESKWRPEQLMNGLVPMMAGVGVHWIASKFGVNRILAKSGVPIIRI